MLPTFNAVGDVVIMERWTSLMKKTKRGDVVIAKSPTQHNQMVCKRVRALAGDVVTVPAGSSWPTHRLVVPPGHVWLEGDNSLNSSDSRMYGPVPEVLIKGHVLIKVL